MSPNRGTRTIPEAAPHRGTTDFAEIDRAIEELRGGAARWVRLGVGAKRELLERLREELAAVADEWVEAGLEAKGLEPDEPAAADEWLGGPYTVLRNVNLLARALGDIELLGAPALPGRVEDAPGGRLAVEVFPCRVTDGVLFPGFEADLWIPPGISREELPQTQATFYRNPTPAERVALVLGAGNVSSIGPMDALYKLFVEGQVVVLKMNPVNDYLGPIFQRGLAPLVEGGFLRLVYGGAAEGAYLCEHPGIDEIHITGSDKTHDAIVFGTGEEGARRKARREPRLRKRITSELGNVSPVIVVPGFWSRSDLSFQAANLVSMLVNNAGFNCNATRLIVQWAPALQRRELLEAVGALLSRTRTRRAYYPGAPERFDAFVGEHPEAELYGRREGGRLPWALIPGLDPENREDICFTTEAFCGVFGEVALGGQTVAEYVDRAVEFVNQTVWGTLSATIVVHPGALRDREVASAVDRAVAKLRYGTVCVNHWPGIAYGLVSTTWGAYPGHELDDIQSGRGVVHNSLMFEKVEKSVVRGPFRVRPLPPWFATHRNAHRVARQLVRFEAEGSWTSLPGLFAAALSG